MINKKKLRLVLRYYWKFFYKKEINFEDMLNKTVYEWVGVNFHSMIWLPGTGPGLYKQIVVHGVRKLPNLTQTLPVKTGAGH